MKKFGFLLALVLSASLTLTACGSSNTVNLELSDSALTPETFTLPVGAQVTINIRNTGTVGYDCDFRDLSTLTLDPGQFYWQLTEIAVGTTKSGTFTAPAQPTTYQIACGPSPFDPATAGTSKALIADLVVK